jgi:mannosyltransferase OCH1-like enzyme
MENLVFQYWENSESYPEGISYINLCHETVDLHSNKNNYKVIRLNSQTIYDYLSKEEINPNIYNLGKNENQIAQKVDYFRVKLLKKYGGLWLDSEALMLRDDVSYIFDKLYTNEFFGYKNQETPNIWAFACLKGAKIMEKWDENNERILNETKGENIFYGELGHQSLIHCLKSNKKEDFKIFWEDIQQLDQLMYECNYKFFYVTEENAYKRYVHEKLPFIMLFNGLTDTVFKTKDRNYFLKNDNKMLFSQLLRYSGIKN